MNEQERLNFLILALASDNARHFSRQTGINPSSLSKIKSGKFHLQKFTGRILAAYPQVNEEWLMYGTGEPIKKKPDKKEIMARLADLEEKVDKLLALMEKVAQNG